MAYGHRCLEELLARLYWLPALRSGSPECSLCVAVRAGALGAAAAAVPARGVAVVRRTHRPYPSGGSPFARSDFRSSRT